MAKYQVIKKFWDGFRLHEPGTIIDHDGPANPETLRPVGAGPHDVAPRRFDLPNTRGVSLIKRAEMYSTQKPMSEREARGVPDRDYIRQLEEQLDEIKAK